jgi:hypothetical protein
MVPKNGRFHNIRTCQEYLKQGRPVMAARDVEAGPYKLVRLGHDVTNDAHSDGIPFSYMDKFIDEFLDNTMEIENTEILILDSNHDGFANEIDKQVTEGDYLKKKEGISPSCIKILPRTTSHDEDSVIELFIGVNSKVCKENAGINISKIDLPTIKWSVKKGVNHPGMSNTCALDSVLYVFYNILKNTMIKNRVCRKDSSTIGIVMDLLSNK